MSRKFDVVPDKDHKQALVDRRKRNKQARRKEVDGNGNASQKERSDSLKDRFSGR